VQMLSRLLLGREILNNALHMPKCVHELSRADRFKLICQITMQQTGIHQGLWLEVQILENLWIVIFYVIFVVT